MSRLDVISNKNNIVIIVVDMMLILQSAVFTIQFQDFLHLVPRVVFAGVGKSVISTGLNLNV